ncbi:MAG: hypothetical protein AB7F66_05895 [Bacteriovoracia bacterium]
MWVKKRWHITLSVAAATILVFGGYYLTWKIHRLARTDAMPLERVYPVATFYEGSEKFELTVEQYSASAHAGIRPCELSNFRFKLAAFDKNVPMEVIDERLPNIDTCRGSPRAFKRGDFLLVVFPGSNEFHIETRYVVISRKKMKIIGELDEARRQALSDYSKGLLVSMRAR